MYSRLCKKEMLANYNELAKHFANIAVSPDDTYRNCKLKNQKYYKKKEFMISNHLNGLWTD